MLGLSLLWGCSSAFAAPGGAAAEASPQALLTLAILGGAALLFFTEAFPLPVTAMLVPVTLSLTGIIPAQTAFTNFGNEWVVVFMAMFIVGEATFITGFADKVGRLTVRFSHGNEKRLLLLSMLSVGLLSGFLSNTGTIAVAIPMILGMCASSNINPRRILMPVAFACSLGGTMTLVGTPPNGLVNSMLSKMGGAGVSPFGFFEFALVGIPLFAAGIILYTFFDRFMLPADTDIKSQHSTHRVEARRTAKMPMAMGIFAFVVIAMATETIPLVTAAMLGACLMIIFGCITMREAFESVDWTTIFLFAGMLSMSTAMDKSGAASFVAAVVVQHVSDPYALLAVTCLLTTVITNFMSNTATAALMAPLAFPIALNAGISPLPLAMGIAMSASCCFLTPIATPPNTIVLGPGNYSFLDYIRYGWVLQVLCVVMSIALIPLFWPFHP